MQMIWTGGSKEYSRLKVRVAEVESTMKETLEFVDKLRVDLDEAIALKEGLENWAKSGEDQVTLLQLQVLELQAQAEEVQAASTKVVELEAELKETMA